MFLKPSNAVYAEKQAADFSFCESKSMDNAPPRLEIVSLQSLMHLNVNKGIWVEKHKQLITWCRHACKNAHLPELGALPQTRTINNMIDHSQNNHFPLMNLVGRQIMNLHCIMHHEHIDDQRSPIDSGVFIHFRHTLGRRESYAHRRCFTYSNNGFAAFVHTKVCQNERKSKTKGETFGAIDEGTTLN